MQVRLRGCQFQIQSCPSTSFFHTQISIPNQPVTFLFYMVELIKDTAAIVIGRWHSAQKTKKKTERKELDLVVQHLTDFHIVYVFFFLLIPRNVNWVQKRPAGQCSHRRKEARTQSELCAGACIQSAQCQGNQAVQLAFHKHATLKQCVNQDPKDKDSVLQHKHTHTHTQVK